MGRSVRTVIDGRKLSEDEIEALRRRVIQSHLNGRHVAKIARDFGLSQSGVNRIIQRFRTKGEAAFVSEKRGSRAGDRKSIPTEVEIKISRVVRDSLPKDNGLRQRFWTGSAISQLLAKQFGIVITDRTGFNYLRRWIALDAHSISSEMRALSKSKGKTDS